VIRAVIRARAQRVVTGKHSQVVLVAGGALQPNPGGNSNMGLDNPIHIAFLLILLLLVFGAKRLPEMGRSLGDGMRGFKDALSGDNAHPAVAQPAAQPIAQPAAPAAAQPIAQPMLVAQPQESVQEPADIHASVRHEQEKLPA
jgi:sec-independent protein translocase protein TatA